MDGSRLQRLALRCLLPFLLSVLATGAHGLVEFNTPFSDFYFGTWNGQGDSTLSQSACIRSEQGGGWWPYKNYRLKAGMNFPAPSAAAPFVMYNTTDSAVSIPFALTLVNLYTSAFHSLMPDVFSPELDACIWGIPNARLDLTLQASDLYQVPAGTYEASLDLEARRVNNGGGLTGDKDIQTNLISRITVPPLVRISNIADINLGTYDGVAATMSYNESYCVYTNTGDYTITPSSTPGSSPTSYALTAGSNQIEYSLRISDTANAATGPPLANGETSGVLTASQTMPFSLTCDDAYNASVYIEISGSELQSKPSGTYSGTLTLQVAPI